MSRSNVLGYFRGKIVFLLEVLGERTIGLAFASSDETKANGSLDIAGNFASYFDDLTNVVATRDAVWVGQLEGNMLPVTVYCTTGQYEAQSEVAREQP